MVKWVAATIVVMVEIVSALGQNSIDLSCIAGRAVHVSAGRLVSVISRAHGHMYTGVCCRVMDLW